MDSAGRTKQRKKVASVPRGSHYAVLYLNGVTSHVVAGTTLDECRQSIGTWLVTRKPYWVTTAPVDDRVALTGHEWCLDVVARPPVLEVNPLGKALKSRGFSDLRMAAEHFIGHITIHGGQPEAETGRRARPD